MIPIENWRVVDTYEGVDQVGTNTTIHLSSDMCNLVILNFALHHEVSHYNVLQ